MNLIPSQFCPASLSLMFGNTSSDPVIIDKVIVRNNDTAPQLLLVYLVSSGDTPGTQNLFVSRNLQPGEVYRCDALVGSELSTNDALWAIAAVDNTIAIHGNGRARRT